MTAAEPPRDDAPNPAAPRAPAHAALYVEAWPEAWRRLAPPYAVVPFPPDAAAALLARTLAALRAARAAERVGGWPEPPDRAAVRGGPLGALARRLDPLVRAHRAAAFVRLGSRSPKDAPWVATAGEQGLRVRTGEEAVALLAAGSARVAHDLRAALAAGYTPHAVVRPWRPVPAWAELRCFVRGRTVVGVTSLRGAGEAWPADVPIATARAAILRTAAAVIDAAPCADLVAELVVERPPDGAVGAWLLDVNPFTPAADPGHFSWADGDDFDGSFRLG